jgi:hypothetical protein
VFTRVNCITECPGFSFSVCKFNNRTIEIYSQQKPICLFEWFNVRQHKYGYIDTAGLQRELMIEHKADVFIVNRIPHKTSWRRKGVALEILVLVILEQKQSHGACNSCTETVTSDRQFVLLCRRFPTRLQ